MKIILLFISTLILVNTVPGQNYGHWIQADSLNIPRYNHASVLMADGNILVSGGSGYYDMLNSCEIYDYKNDEWHLTTPMNSKRYLHRLVLLPNNKILAIGGWKNSSCEIFDPETETWKYTDSLKDKHWDAYTVTELQDGKVLICGGYYLTFDGNPSVQLNSCEIYDYKTEKWTYAAPMHYKRSGHSATLLKNGKVLVVGGSTDNAFELNKCEIYDPEENRWIEIDSLKIARDTHNAILLQNGKVLISGGLNYHRSGLPWLSNCEIYDFSSNEWINANSMIFARNSHLAFQIDNTNILFFGGSMGSNTWEIYNIDSLKTIFLADYPVRKELPTAHMLLNGEIISIGGYTWTDTPTPNIYPTGSCEIFTPRINNIEKGQKKQIITDFQLLTPFPNPFNNFTVIKYKVFKIKKIKIEIYNILGERVTTLVNEIKKPGYFEIKFNGSSLGSGIYFIFISDNFYRNIKKLVKIN
ncbi:Kelch repeat-containing protein [Calditrichota bacterium GD2]